MIWSALTTSSGWDGVTECKDAHGTVLWKGPSPSTDARSAAGLAIDGIVVQPDKGKVGF